LFTLFFVLVSNTIGHGSQTSAEVLSWIYLGLGVIWILLELFVGSVSAVRLGFGIVEFGIALVILILAFSLGFGWV
jgi:hypothetical protein